MKGINKSDSMILDYRKTCSQLHSSYEQKLSEWGALEAIVQQQDRETTAANIARISCDKEESYPHSPTPDRPSTITEVETQLAQRGISSNLIR